MGGQFPDHHENPETFYDGLVQEFTDDAIYPQPKNGPASSGPDETKPPVTPPPERPTGSEAEG